MFFQFWKERMRKNYLRNKETSSLHDIVFLMAAGFFVLFMVSFFYVNPVAKLGKITKSAEFIITVTWPDDMVADIDAWVKDPNDIIIWYNAKAPSNSLVHLERDDLGGYNDTVSTPTGVIKIAKNEEMVTIRGIHPGRYVLNLHYYNSHHKKAPIPVNVKIEKLNPVVTTVFSTKNPIIMLNQGDEVTVVHFSVDLDGTVKDISTTPFISLRSLNGERPDQIEGEFYR